MSELRREIKLGNLMKKITEITTTCSLRAVIIVTGYFFK